MKIKEKLTGGCDRRGMLHHVMSRVYCFPGRMSLETVVESWLPITSDILAFGLALAARMERFSGCICAYDVFYIVGVGIEKSERGGPEPDPIAVFRPEPVHDGHYLPLEFKHCKKRVITEDRNGEKKVIGNEVKT